MPDKKDPGSDEFAALPGDANFQLIFHTPEELNSHLESNPNPNITYSRSQLLDPADGENQPADPLRVTTRSNSSLRASGRARAGGFLPLPQRATPLARSITKTVTPQHQPAPTQAPITKRRFVPEGTQVHQLSGPPQRSLTDQTGASIAAATDAAREIVTTAQAEAERLIRDAKRFVEAEKDRARDIGLQEGKREATQIVLDAHTARRDLLDGARRDAEEIIFAVAEEVIGATIVGDRTTILGRIERAFGYLLNAAHITFAVSPEDVEVVREKIGELANGLGYLGECLVRPDQEIARGCARLESDLCIVEADLKTHLDALRDHVSELLALNTAEEEALRTGRTH